MTKLADIAPGTLFRYADRICVMEEHENGPLIKSMTDGWSGFVKWQEGREGTHKMFTPVIIEMPTTAYELLKFIREVQYREEQ